MKATIYKLFNENNCYIGQTTSSLNRRLSEHKNNHKRFLKGFNRYCSAGVIIDEGNYRIECLEEVDYENKFELLQLEKKYIQEINCVNIIYKCHM